MGSIYLGLCVFFFSNFIPIQSKASERVLITYFDVGDGHKNAAAAVDETLVKYRSNTVRTTIDLLPLTDDNGRRALKRHYEWCLEKFPKLWDFEFFTLFNFFGAKMIERLNQGLITPHIKKTFREFNPTVVVATHPAAAMIAELMRQKGVIDLNTKVINLVTDYYFGEAYNSRFVLLPSRALYDDAIARGRNPNTVAYTDGILTKSTFRKKYTKEQRDAVFRRIEFDPKIPTFVFAGGSAGIYLERLVEFLPLWEPTLPIQVVIVTGKNDQLKAEFESILKLVKLHPNIRGVYLPGYAGKGDTPTMLDLMEIARPFVSKAGGITTTERLSRGEQGRAQLVLPDEDGGLHPGQERANTNMFGKQRTLDVINDISDLNDVGKILALVDAQEARIPVFYPDIMKVDQQFIAVYEQVLRHPGRYPNPRRLKTKQRCWEALQDFGSWIGSAFVSAPKPDPYGL